MPSHACQGAEARARNAELRLRLVLLGALFFPRGDCRRRHPHADDGLGVAHQRVGAPMRGARGLQCPLGKLARGVLGEQAQRHQRYRAERGDAAEQRMHESDQQQVKGHPRRVKERHDAGSGEQGA